MVTKRIGFFGDSWVAGCEANEIDGTDSPEFAFPSYFENSINLGVTGSSIEGVLSVFYSHQADISQAVFCLTDPARRYYVDTDSVIDGNLGFNPLLSRLSNDLNDDYIVSKTCGLLYLLCLHNNTECYFVNLFGGQYCSSEFWNIIPEDNWLLPKNTCLAKEIFDRSNTWADNPNGAGDYSYWLDTNNTDVEYFVRPNTAHPNKNGHLIISDFIKSKIGV